MQRRKSREYALQIIFRLDFTDKKLDSKDLEEFWSDKKVNKNIKRFTEDIVKGTLSKIDDIDKMIEEVTENWVLKRMAIVDRNILRCAVYEIIYRKDIPSAVTINEAIEIAKKFSSTDSASFINGILDKISKEIEQT